MFETDVLKDLVGTLFAGEFGFYYIVILGNYYCRVYAVFPTFGSRRESVITC